MSAFRFAAAIGAAGVLLLSSCASGPTEQGGEDEGDFSWSDVEPVELTWSTPHAEGAAWSIMGQKWRDTVTERTEGKVTFDYYGAATLHPATEALSALESGLTDMTLLAYAYFPDQLPVSTWENEVAQGAARSFGFPNQNIAGMGLHIENVSNNGVDTDRLLREEQVGMGFIPMLPMFGGPTALVCSEPFETAADLAGRSVRVSSALSQAEYEALGMVGTFIPVNEQYEALQRGVIDCASNAPASIVSLGLLEVAPWLTLPQTAPGGPADEVISVAAWEDLIPEVREVMLDARTEAHAEFSKLTLDVYAQLVDETEKAGGGIVDPATLNRVIDQYWEDRPSPAETAPSAVTDPEAEVARITALAEDWRDITVDEIGVPEGRDDLTKSLGVGADVLDEEGWAKFIDALDRRTR